MQAQEATGFKRADDTAKYLSVSKSTVWLYAKQGKLKKIKLSDRVTVFALEDIEAFIADRSGGAK